MAHGKPPPKPDSDWLTVGEVAESLRINVDTVLTWIRRGTLEAVNVSGGELRPTWRIRRESFERMIADRAAVPESKIVETLVEYAMQLADQMRVNPE